MHNINKNVAFLTIVAIITAIFVGCSKTNNDNASSETSVSEIVSETASSTAPGNDSNTPESEYTVSIGATEEEYIIYWEENGEEKSQSYTGYVSPYTIINDVLCKYYGENSNPGIYNADWYVTEYYEDIECEDGLARNVLYTGILDLSEGYSTYVGPENIEKVTKSIAKSFIDSYNLESIKISELKEDILYFER